MNAREQPFSFWWVLSHIITIPTLHPSTREQQVSLWWVLPHGITRPTVQQMLEYNLTLLVAFHPIRHGHKSAPIKQEHNKNFATNYQDRGWKGLIFSYFYLTSKFLGMCVHRYTDNYGLYSSGPELQPAIIYFYTLLLPMDKTIHYYLPKPPRSYPWKQIFKSNMVESSETAHSTQASPGCNILNIIFFIIINLFGYTPSFKLHAISLGNKSSRIAYHATS